MAKSYWKGSNGSWTDTGNWTAGVPGSASGVVAVFDGRSNVSPSQNLDQSGASFAFQLITTDKFRGDIGNEGNPLSWQWATTSANVIRGTGSCFLDLPVGGVTSSGGRLVVDSQNRVNAVTLYGGGDSSTAWVSFLMVKAGKVIVRGDLDFGSVDTCVLMTTGQTAHVELREILGTEDPPAWIHCFEGTIDNYRDLAGGDLVTVDGGGTMIQRGDPSGGDGISIGARGTFKVVSSGNVTLPTMTIDGTLDLSGVAGDVTTSTNHHIITQNGSVIPPAGDTISGGFEGVSNAYDLSEEYPQ